MYSPEADPSIVNTSVIGSGSPSLSVARKSKDYRTSHHASSKLSGRETEEKLRNASHR